MNGVDTPRPAVTPVKQGFHLDRANAKVFGVCAGIARHFDIDPMIIRVAFAAGTTVPALFF